jgi:hypothetical protein
VFQGCEGIRISSKMVVICCVVQSATFCNAEPTQPHFPPTATTTTPTTSFGGTVAWSVDEFVQAAVELALEKSSYVDAVRRGQAILHRTQDKGLNWAKLGGALTTTEMELSRRRKYDYTRALLWHHSARSTEYFSRWIELKEAMRKEDKE